MKKRQFLKLTALSGAGTMLSSGVSFASSSTLSQAPFALPELKYGYDALMPHIDKETMKIHHSRHFKGYTDNLNAAIESTSYATRPIGEILKSVKASDTDIRNNGGGYYNHKLFFESLTPSAKAKPVGELGDAIDRAFGSFEEFKDQFAKTAMGQFGSGWAWLILGSGDKLSLVSTPNQDNPLMQFSGEQGYPLMGIDVWEHAYYLNFRNDRAAYIHAFWEVLDWDFVDLRYQTYIRQS